MNVVQNSLNFIGIPIAKTQGVLREAPEEIKLYQVSSKNDVYLLKK